ncbi:MULTISPECIES: eCIS core domain-containing protein [Streptomyces]|uniref:eCIS core domain-containing protein n=1 Tax=Streptomyces TaxID=1883 RepID=UPI0011CD6941|nr:MULTISPECIES: DUF4157 domain-containing protein [unclassified Streptomyces]MCC4320462.1 DUF4157 domain-containing protein [Streptomyces malaysiensis]MCQ6251277.1 DUF4157 domain-containing protein [Streptomyces malaysiensis]WHX23965.1 DUF4157 domain-containing protein [Streptomyces sp. NA07423]
MPPSPHSQTLQGAEPQRAQSFYQNPHMSAARIHTGPIAQRAVEAFGAEAVTLGTDVMLSSRAKDNAEVLGHELSHVDTNLRGIIETGKEQGHGTLVTDPGQLSERAAGVDGAAWKAGEEVAPFVLS